MDAADCRERRGERGNTASVEIRLAAAAHPAFRGTRDVLVFPWDVLGSWSRCAHAPGLVHESSFGRMKNKRGF